MDFFKHFGREWYTLPSGESVYMTDLTKRIALTNITKSTLGTLLNYTIRDGETPESIAVKLYGDSSYWWLVLLPSQLYEQDSWPTLEQYLEEKVAKDYPETNIHSIKHHIDSKGVITDLNAIRMRTGVNGTANYFGLTPVTYYEHERKVNDSKRNIKLVDPALATFMKSKMIEVLQDG